MLYTFCNYYKFFFGYLSRLLLQHTQLNNNNYYHNTIEKKNQNTDWKTKTINYSAALWLR